MEFKVLIRPFLYSQPGKPSSAYELILTRSEGDRIYDRRIAIISGTDASDIVAACPTITYQRLS